MASTPPTYFPDNRPAALVVSHQRSGTHFLMNSLATCYGYVSFPWFNFDPLTCLHNIFNPVDMTTFLLAQVRRPLANTMKSHHMAESFAGQLPALAERFAVLYVYRDPVAVMLSYWRFVLRWAIEGPRTPDPITFARAEPSAGMLRYQVRQYPDVLRRWAAHVEGWLALAQEFPAVALIRYEELDANFEQVVQGLSGVLQRSPLALTRPPREGNVIPGASETPEGTTAPPDKEALRRLCRETVGDTMAKLGY